MKKYFMIAVLLMTGLISFELSAQLSKTEFTPAEYLVNQANEVVSVDAMKSHDQSLQGLQDEEVVVNFIAKTSVIHNTYRDELRIRLDYISPLFFKYVSFDLTVLDDWNDWNYWYISILDDYSHLDVVEVSANKWRVILETTSYSSGFQPSSKYRPWLEIWWRIGELKSEEVEFVIDNIEVRDHDKQIINATKELRQVVDSKKSTETDAVKFSLAWTANGLSVADYNSSKHGNLILDFIMDNTKNDLKLVSFNISMPDYFTIENVAITIGAPFQFANVVQTSSGGGVRNYLVTASAPSEQPWLPNSELENPKVMMKICFNFTDLPCDIVNFQVSNIIAKNSDDLQVNETLEHEYAYNFISEFYRFEKGDVDDNFGDGDLDWNDFNLLRDYLNGTFTTPSLYQLWAFDINDDGVIDKKDYDWLFNYLKKKTSVRDEYDSEVQVYPNPSPGVVTVVNSTEAISQLLIYDMSGNLVHQQELQGSAKLNLNVASGYYYWRIINGQKTVGNSLIINR